MDLRRRNRIEPDAWVIFLAACINIGGGYIVQMARVAWLLWWKWRRGR